MSSSPSEQNLGQGVHTNELRGRNAVRSTFGHAAHPSNNAAELDRAFWFPFRPVSERRWKRNPRSTPGKKFVKRGCNTRTSQEVTHPSTTHAQARLTAEF